MRSLRANLLCTNYHTGGLRSPTTRCATEADGSAAVSSRRLSATTDWSQRYGRCSAASAQHIMLIYSYPILVAAVRQVLGGLGVLPATAAFVLNNSRNAPIGLE